MVLDTVFLLWAFFVVAAIALKFLVIVGIFVTNTVVMLGLLVYALKKLAFGE